MTLHGFALRQLLRNAHLVDTLPVPLRVADDWEESNIIVPDLQRLLGLKQKAVKPLLFGMSADWDSLNDAEANADPKFIAAWRSLRNVYGFTLRAEMVYRLKRAMEQHDKFELECDYEHLIVDEFQDLNPCDLAVVAAMRDLGSSVYCAGDDDQSIYGFRKASPAGIREFPVDYAGCEDHKITLCKRCDSGILQAAEFVADQDLARIPKDIRAEAEGGLVQIAHFADQAHEAAAIASGCRQLHEMGYGWGEIAILLRSDRYGRFSEPIVQALTKSAIPVSTHRTNDPLSERETRFLYALVQLVVNAEDSVAARVLLQLSAGVGDGTIADLEGFALSRGIRFIEAFRTVAADPSVMPRSGSRIAKAWSAVEAAGATLAIVDREEGEPPVALGELRESLETSAAVLGIDSHSVDDLMAIIGEVDGCRLSDIVTRSASVSEGLEPRVDVGAVNVMTMHQAKGLTFDCVIIPGLEDQLLPGECADLDEEGDERRLLYVSMTRAKHALLLLYANKRTGDQAHSGRAVGKGKQRVLTRFLADYKFK